MIRRMWQQVESRLAGVHFKPRTFVEAQLRFDAAKALLVVGLPRSGTSLMQAVLNQHEEVFVAYESIHEPFIHEHNQARLAAFYYESLRQYHHLAAANVDGNSDLKPTLYTQNYTYLGNKSIFRSSQKYKNSLSRALATNDRLKVLFLTRDPRDRFLSVDVWKQKRNKSFVQTLEPDLEIQQFIKQENSRTNDFYQFAQAHKDHINTMQMSYEDFVFKADSLQDICDFLELPLSSKIENYYLQKVSGQSVGKWPELLDPSLCQLIESGCNVPLANG